MSKLFGALLIFTCGLLLSCTPLLKLMERKQLLFALIYGLERMKAELSTAAPTLPQLMKKMREYHPMFEYILTEMQQEGPMSFYDAWHSYVERAYCLGAEERDALHNLGDALGRYVLEEQLAAIERTVPVLREGHTQAKDELREVSRLYIGTGLSLSAMLVIVLL